MIRAFLGIQIPSKIAEELAQLGKHFESKNFKPVRAENIHLTIKFLGNVNEEELFNAANRLENLLKKISPFPIEIGSLGAFPSEKKARVFWIGVDSGLDKLHEVYDVVNRTFASLGVEDENRFKPHITIGRFRVPENIESKLKIINKDYKIKYQVEVDSVKVYKSTLTPQGPIYEVLRELKLQERQ